ncbi:MAG: hypothetical protein JXC36_04545 [Candidatus Atribacteria bacterium]|nr:hypothetical protein [Candidatus Atribacteria bacterium]
MSKSNITSLFRYLFVTFFVFFSCNVEQSTLDEPPMNYGRSSPGEMVGSTKMIGFGSDNSIIYEISYPQWNLTSTATIGLRTNALREEVFEGKWKNVYKHEKYPEVYATPSTIIVYAYNPNTGDYTKEINRYTLSRMETNELYYRDSRGKIVRRDMSYFEVQTGFSPHGFGRGF